MNDKKVSRQRRAKRSRMKIREQGVTRLCINRTPRHIYAQIIAAEGDKVLATASTLKKTYVKVVLVISMRRQRLVS